MPKVRFPPECRRTVRAMLADGCTVADVARAFGASYKGAQEAVARFGLRSRGRGGVRDVYKDAAVMALVAGGATTAKRVAALTGVKVPAVHARMARLRAEGLLRMTGWVRTARWEVTERWTDARCEA